MKNLTNLKCVATVLTFLSMPLFAQVNESASVNEGVMRVKLKPKLSSVLAKSRSLQGNMVIGHVKLDAANKSVRAYRMQRVFPYNEKHEENYRKYGLDRWYEIYYDKSIRAYDALSNYYAIEDIEIAEPSLEIELIGTNQSTQPFNISEIINDPYLAKQWHYQNTGDVLPSRKGADINLFNAWSVTKGNPNVVVSVVDGGIDIAHNDLKDNLWVNTAELNGTPGVDDDGNGFIDDIHGVNFVDLTGKVTPHEHGTHVAGTIAASNNNGLGVAGVAGGSGNKDGVRLMSCQVFNSKGLSGNFARAIVYGADQGAVISQNSWGYKSPEVYEQVVLDAIDYFSAEAGNYPGSPMKGGVVIFAAGNESSSEKFYPGAYESVISVASMGPDFKKASYSNYGDWVDIVAPGGESGHGTTWGIFSTYPENRYAYMDGTSMACPHVSGIAALVVSKFGSPSFTNTQLKKRLLTASQNIEQYNPDFIGKLGSGYIDAFKALAVNGFISPEQITDFAVEGVAQDFVQLSWSAVKDNDDEKAYRYEVYYSKTPVSEAQLNQASVYSVKQFDTPVGQKMNITITGLDP
ncbi:MAG: S8 family serine peptidase, partial [Bacteroidales bacterium]